jgi:O-antigen ligase
VAYNSISKGSIEKWVNAQLIIGVIFAFLGFFQLAFFSNLSFLQAFGWDPHQMRLVSTLLDPNFAGCIFAILASLSISFYLYKNRKIYLFASAVFILAIILTFSRSSYLAIATVVATVGSVKAPRVLLISVAVFMLAFTTIGQVRSRIIGALTIDETATARIESWQRAITIFKGNELLGVGFNTYRYAQASFGFFSFDNPLGGHSGAGSDSSILLVAATTGIIGLGLYLYLLINIFRVFKNKARSTPLHLGALAAFLGLIVDSQFVNSLFFPQVMLVFYFILGLALKNDS